MHKALFLDLDGTVRKTLVKDKFCPSKPEEQAVLEGRHERIWEYKRKGYKIFAVTNQGGIGLGLMSKEECEDCLKDLNDKLDGAFDDMVYAPSIPMRNDHFTKPNPGMLFSLAEKHGIDLKKSMMVGDRDTDKMAAKRAGVPFTWAKEFFK
jgi:D-glycero-D-manno-heptose 1,7-bisphosphate phosphatase